jgi:DNA polymerase-3 subunit delta
VLAIAARAGRGVAQLDPPNAEAWKEELNIELAEADVDFLKEVAVFCAEERITAPESDVSALVDLLEKGLPRGQVLVIATSDLDAKNPLVKWISERGRLVERKVASKLKELDLSEIAAGVLGPSKKKLSRAAEARLKERCGGNMRLLQSELEKLALYVEGSVIEEGDVELLVAHAREEEFLELSDALQKRTSRRRSSTWRTRWGRGRTRCSSSARWRPSPARCWRTTSGSRPCPAARCRAPTTTSRTPSSRRSRRRRRPPRRGCRTPSPPSAP